ncbi:hypothetical protein, partial [Salmonella sp. hn-h2]|uniref:hypothetical protein n=1 Tax=Salmonella sp. hn-h2 TaxID=2582611 RepID=UPI001F374F4C
IGGSAHGAGSIRIPAGSKTGLQDRAGHLSNRVTSTAASAAGAAKHAAGQANGSVTATAAGQLTGAAGVTAGQDGNAVLNGATSLGSS